MSSQPSHPYLSVATQTKPQDMRLLLAALCSRHIIAVQYSCALKTANNICTWLSLCKLNGAMHARAMHMCHTYAELAIGVACIGHLDIFTHND